MIEEIGDVKMLIIDPITAYLGDVDSHRTTDIRAVLEPLDKFIQKYSISLFAITHPPKSSQKAMNSFTGSLAFVAAPRLAFLVAPEPEETGRVLFLAVKNNIGPLAEGLGYRIEGGQTKLGIDTSRVVWDNKPVRLTADEAMGEEEPVSSALKNAEKFLEEFLKNGPQTAEDVYEKAEVEGISTKTLKRAKKELGIKSTKPSLEEGWLWELPSKQGS
jgi:putative DNA primase/helicase